MNREKIVEQISVLKTLVEDWDNLESRELQEQAEVLIIANAAELVKLAAGAKKSEMAYNSAPKKEIVLSVEEVRKCFHTVVDVVLNKFESFERN